MAWLEQHYLKVWLVYTVIVAVAWLHPLRVPYLSEALLIGYVLLSIAWFRISGFSLRGSSTGEFLCDTCKFNYGDACRRPERPNAKGCPDYKSQ